MRCCRTCNQKTLTPSRKPELAKELTKSFGASVRKPFAALKLSRTVYLYRSVVKDESALILRMKEITQTRVHFGYRRVHVMLRREGFKDNHKRVYRLYREQGLSLRHKRPKRDKAAKLRQPKTSAQRVNQVEHGLCGRQPV
jgi:putative transposase